MTTPSDKLIAAEQTLKRIQQRRIDVEKLRNTPQWGSNYSQELYHLDQDERITKARIFYIKENMSA